MPCTHVSPPQHALDTLASADLKESQLSVGAAVGAKVSSVIMLPNMWRCADTWWALPLDGLVEAFRGAAQPRAHVSGQSLAAVAGSLLGHSHGTCHEFD